MDMKERGEIAILIAVFVLAAFWTIGMIQRNKFDKEFDRSYDAAMKP